MKKRAKAKAKAKRAESKYPQVKYNMLSDKAQRMLLRIMKERSANWGTLFHQPVTATVTRKAKP